jgi:hypothetical protein
MILVSGGVGIEIKKIKGRGNELFMCLDFYNGKVIYTSIDVAGTIALAALSVLKRVWSIRDWEEFEDEGGKR